MTKTIPLLQLTLVLGLGLGVSACQTVSDAASGVGDAMSGVGDSVASAASSLNPMGWFGGDEAAPPADSETQTASADTSVGTSSDLSRIPARPATSSPAQQQAAAQSLAADGAQARYSADSLRAGTEAAAAPPGAADVPPSARLAANDAPPTTDAPPSAQAAAAPPPPSALTQGTSAVPTGASPSRPVQTVAVAPQRAVAPPPGAQPAVPPNTPVRGAAMTNQVASDAALGFRPSAAPPLDPSISQWVSAPIVARYRQTASNAGVAAVRQAAVPPKGSAPDMSGAVVTNLDAVSMGPAAAAIGGGAPPTAVVFFPGDGTTLSTAARNQIRNTVAQYKASGGGAVRVVGHASSRTANMPVEKHLELIFEKSQQRADAVAQELIRAGVPADRVLIEAVGDSQPVYYESMPQGEEGNRRAEIFVQG